MLYNKKLFFIFVKTKIFIIFIRINDRTTTITTELSVKLISEIKSYYNQQKSGKKAPKTRSSDPKQAGRVEKPKKKTGTTWTEKRKELKDEINVDTKKGKRTH